MRTGILSDKERGMLKEFLASGTKGQGFRMLKLRIKRNYPTITEDFEIISKVKDKLQ